jgi:prephenate dehydrogenase
VGKDVQAITGGDGLGFAPKAPHRGAVATLTAAVLDVIVDKGEIVDQFDGCRRGESTAVVAAHSLAGEDTQQGTK